MMHRLLQNKLGIILISALLLTEACAESSFFSQSINFEDSVWNEDEVAEFQLDITEPKQNYYLFFDLKSSENFATSNLWIFAEVHAPDGTVQTDTLEFDMADDTGKWLGKHTGSEVETTLLYKRDVAFPAAGAYKFRFRQGMRDDQTPLLSEFSLRAEILETDKN